jgi:hypothetical protein
MAAKCRADRAALEALPGVGRKTANVVLNTAFGEPTIAVDTHIFRLGQPHRPGAGQDRAGRRNPAAAPHAAEFKQDAHHWLILHGRYVCKARKPDCAVCVIADLCDFKEKTVMTAETAHEVAGALPRAARPIPELAAQAVAEAMAKAGSGGCPGVLLYLSSDFAHDPEPAILRRRPRRQLPAGGRLHRAGRVHRGGLGAGCPGRRRPGLGRRGATPATWNRPIAAAGA